MDTCSGDWRERLVDRVRFLTRRFSASAGLAPDLRSLAQRLESQSGDPWRDATRFLEDLSGRSPVVRAAMEEYDEKESVDRAEAFLADLAEDRSTAPPEILPLVDHYISRVREVISLSWDRRLGRRELDASVIQVRLSYSQDLDRILQSLQPHAV